VNVRPELSALANGEFDVVVVGGGIGGAAVAWDAALRGLSVALVERADFGGATSAESLKVVHGGIRYLQHLDVARVRESSRERSALIRIAPHLVHPLPYVIPTYGYGARSRWLLGAGFGLLSALTADRNRGIADPARRLPGARLVSRREALGWFPDLESNGLTGAGVFWEGQLYNPPRLVWAFIRSAIRAGAVAANHCEVTALLRLNGRVAGVRVEDRLGGESFDIRGRVVVNAAGPYAEALLRKSGLREGIQIPFSRDMAFVIRRPLVEQRALALQTRYRDPDALFSRGNRHIFLVPWHGRTLIGVNSVIWREHPDDLRVTEEEIEGFLEEINEAGPYLRLTREDVALVLAGLLPIQAGELVGANVSFGKRPLVIDHAGADGVEGLVSAVCNRYTVARGVAERAVDLTVAKLGRKAARCRTEYAPLDGGEAADFAALVREAGSRAGGRLAPAGAERLAHNHGSGFERIFQLAEGSPELLGEIGSSGVLRAEVIYAIRSEMAHRLADVVFRRTDLGTGGDPGEVALVECAGLIARECGWSAERTREELGEVRARFGRAPMGFRASGRN
jgi:glycerol-3-phosphate dehydrogenase